MTHELDQLEQSFLKRERWKKEWRRLVAVGAAALTFFGFVGYIAEQEKATSSELTASAQQFAAESYDCDLEGVVFSPGVYTKTIDGGRQTLVASKPFTSFSPPETVFEPEISNFAGRPDSVSPLRLGIIYKHMTGAGYFGESSKPTVIDERAILLKNNQLTFSGDTVLRVSLTNEAYAEANGKQAQATHTDYCGEIRVTTEASKVVKVGAVR